MAILKATNQYEKTENGAYRVKGENPRIGKMAGTFIGGIMNRSRWETPFSIATKLLRIYDEDLGDVPAIKAGKYLEPVILNYLDKSGRLPNTQAEVLYPGYEEGNHADWKSHFEDDFFSGHFDAIAGHVTDARLGYGIVENKTTSHIEDWDFVNNIPPEHYWLQASTYAYFLGYEDIFFTVGILTPEEQENPSKFVPDMDNVKVMKVGLYPDFESLLNRAKEWYIAYIRSGVTPVPDMDNPIDARIAHALDAQIATADEILPVFNEYVKLNTEYNALGKVVEDLRNQIMLYLETNELDGIGNSAMYYKYSVSKGRRVDTDRLKEDGLYDTYSKESVTKSLRKAKFRE